MDHHSLSAESPTSLLSDPEWLMFDNHPELFVDLTHTPIVFTVRGLAHFSPLFRRLGISTSQVITRKQFEDASIQASMLEMEDLAIKINERARSGRVPSEYKVLNAYLHGTKADVEHESRRLAHKNACNLHII